MLDDRGGFPQQCGKLCTDPDQRLAWGCDGPTASELHVVELACFVCHGKDEDCAECAGSGRIQIHECPWRLIQPEHEEAITAAVQMERGILPAEGGWQDQSATFVAAYPLLLNEVAHWRNVAMERATKNPKR